MKVLVVLERRYIINIKQAIAYNSINLTDDIAFQTIQYILILPCPGEIVWP